MPRWTLYTREGTFSTKDKQHIAQEVAALYVTLGIPAFLVNVFFNEYKDGYYSGGKAEHNCVFCHIDHAARSFKDEEERLKFLSKIDEIIKPVLSEKCMKWEFNIYDHPNTNWRVNGMIPPVSQPELWQQWIEKNEPVPY